MRNLKFLFIAALFQGFVLNALGQGGSIQSYFSYALFQSPKEGPFIETYLSVNGASVLYQMKEDSTFQGEIAVSIIFTQNDTVKQFKKYNLSSPIVKDTSKGFTNFLDIQRIPLENGEYTMELYLSDVNAKGDVLSSKKKVIVDFPKQHITISDIELVESYTPTESVNQLSKSGVDIVPLVSDYLPERLGKMTFYAELYNADKTFEANPYLLTYYIIESESGQTMEDYKYMQRQTPKPISVLLKTIDISLLPSGNYYLVIEARTPQNELAVRKQLFFFRSNSAVTKSISELSINELATVNINKTFINKLGGQDTLKDLALSISPIAGNSERAFISKYFDKKDPDVDVMKRFLFVFWSSRNQYNPEQAFIEYQQKVHQVNQMYSTSIKRGYETDRGRVYLQYGKPNTMVKRPHDPNKYPYEIWHYYDAQKRSNGRFVFYSRDLVTNDYELLHSDVYGEINQPRWQYLLEQRTEEINDLDQNRGRDYFGNQTDEFFDLPR